jgi:alpha-galactosidase
MKTASNNPLKSHLTRLNAPAIFVAAFLLVGINGVRASYTYNISDLDISQMEQGLGTPQADKSVDGHPLSLAGRMFTNGVGTLAPSQFIIDVSGQALNFSATVGVDDEVGQGRGGAVFKVIGDDRPLWTSKKMRSGDVPESVSVSLTNVNRLMLLVEGSKGSSDHADWADAKLLVQKKRPSPAIVSSIKEAAVILTPKPSPKPRINSAKVFGVRPGAPFLYTIAATGDRPMTFAADGLPAGLQLDPQTGIITGSLPEKGEHAVTLRAKNKRDEATRKLKIICGSKIGLTPALGWNSWNCFANSVTEEKVKSAADAMVSSGLINHGWTYVNIDEFWAQNPAAMAQDPTLGGPGRDAQGCIVPNPRFPDMKGLADYIHSRGLKAGLYSSPGPFACGGCLGSFDHELLDAQSYAAWGFDYLKYDWCSYRPDLEKTRTRPVDFSPMNQFLTNGTSEDVLKQMRPYAVMRSALDQANRDIIYSFCQYGNGNSWEWVGALGGNSGRTTYDIIDKWKSPDGLSLSDIGFSQNGHEKFAGPGHFNDPDMLVIGKVGWGPRLHATRLTPNEQYTHISLWCLLASPLLIGCDMTQMDDFTLSLLTNDEVLEVDQDPLGRQAARVAQDGAFEVWAKDMEDGSKAVGLFNRSYKAGTVTVKWSDLGLTGKHKVRDLWRQKDLGKFKSEFKAEVPRHGVVLIKIGK